jgi:hypothetical protein
MAAPHVCLAHTEGVSSPALTDAEAIRAELTSELGTWELTAEGPMLQGVRAACMHFCSKW